MRFAFLSLALALAVALAWLAFSTQSVQPSPLSSTVSAQESPLDRSPIAREDIAAPEPTSASVDERVAESSLAPAPSSHPPIRFNELELLGRLVSVNGAPLPGYTVLVAPTGLKPHVAASVPSGQRCVTDADGHCAFAGLAVPGPWDVYAFPMDLGVDRGTIERRARVGTVTAGNPGQTERVTFSIVTGPTVTLRSPLPDSVKAEDLWFEVLPMSGEIKDTEAKTIHRYAQGAPTEEGHVKALLPAISDPFPQTGFSVHIRSLDGLFALVSTSKADLAGQLGIVIDEPLEKRGRVRIQIAIRDVRPGVEDSPMGDEDWAHAIETVDWRLLLQDPTRSGADLPGDFRTTSRNQRWTSLGSGAFELTDLPLDIPMELGVLGPSLGPSLGPTPGSDAFVPETLGRATPVHGDPEPVEVRIRRVR